MRDYYNEDGKLPYYVHQQGKFFYSTQAFDPATYQPDPAIKLDVPNGTVFPDLNPTVVAPAATPDGRLQTVTLTADDPGIPADQTFFPFSPAAGQTSPRLMIWDQGQTGLSDPTSNAESVARLYQDVLGRRADAGGLYNCAHQVDDGTISLRGIADALLASPEFLSSFGNTALSRPAQFVDRLYRDMFDRPADPGGGYVAAISGGIAPGQIALDISRSLEAWDTARTFTFTGDRNESTLYRLYESILGRAPDPAGEAAYVPHLDASVSPVGDRGHSPRQRDVRGDAGCGQQHRPRSPDVPERLGPPGRSIQPRRLNRRAQCRVLSRSDPL